MYVWFFPTTIRKVSIELHAQTGHKFEILKRKLVTNEVTF